MAAPAKRIGFVLFDFKYALIACCFETRVMDTPYTPAYTLCKR
jgi:hypothetical protein